MSKKGKVGTSGREIAKALWGGERPETEQYKEDCAARGLHHDIVPAPRLPKKENRRTS